MKLERLEIRQLEGLDGSFALEGLAPGVNVVLGPNAIGKSSLGRAFLALLRPARGDGFSSLSAEFSAPTGRWRVQRDHGPQARWFRDGAPAGAPQLLEPELLVGLVIRNEDLAGQTRGTFDSDLTRRIARELAGGFDLGRLRELDELRMGAQAGGNERRALDQARNARRSVESAQAELRRRAESLDELRRELAAARAAQAELGRVEATLELVELRRRADEAATALEAFPRALENLAPNDAKRLEQLEQKLEATRAARSAAEQDLRDAARELAESGLEGTSVTAASVKQLQTRLRRLERTGERLRDARSAEAQAAAQLEAARAALGAPPSRSARAITRADVEQTRDTLESLLALRATQSATRARLDGLSGAAPDPARERLVQRGLAALEDWLRAPRATALPERRAPVLLALLVAAGTLLAIFAEPALAKALGLALVAGGALVFGLLRPAGSTDTDGAARAERDFGGLALDPPAAWESAAVRERHAALMRELAAAERAALEDGQRRQLEPALARATAEIERLLADLGARAAELGFDPRKLDASLLRWLELLRQHDEALMRLASAEAAREELESAFEQEGQALGAALAASGLATAEERDPLVLAGNVEELEGRVGRRDGALALRGTAERALERAERELGEWETELAELYRAAAVEVGERAELSRRIEALPAYSAARQAARDAAGQVKAQERRLAQDFEPLAADDPESLAARRSELEQDAQRQNQLVEHIAGIEKELDLARAGARLETALDAERKAEENLSACLEGQLVAAAGQFLLERIEAGHRDQRTGALARAEEWFARFTHHRFELVVQGGSTLELRAHDVRMGETRALEALSTATRVQLLLAVRLAFLEEAERGRETLPLFLDEVLATSDLDRSRQVMETVAELARAGRQVLYLTAQPEEASRWRAALGPDVAVHDLGAIRSRAAAAPLPELHGSPELETIPAPEGLTAEEYARVLRVPALDPWRADALHPFHLLGDRLELLHRLLLLRCTSLAQLERLLGAPRVPQLLDTADREELRLRCEAARAALVAWTRGRPRPVPRELIASSNAVTDKFHERVLALLDEVGGDARAFLEAMEDKDRRPKGFRTEKLQDLRAELEQLGLLPDGPVSSPEELRLQALATAAGLGRDVTALEGGWLDVLLARLAALTPDAGHPARA